MLIFRLSLLWVIACTAAPVFPAEDAASVAGTYRDEKIVIALDAPQTSGADVLCTGSIRLGDETFPLKARVLNGRLQGTFTSQGDAFEFTAVPAGRTLEFTTGGTTYYLMKPQTANPLAKPAKPNPLSRPQVPAASDRTAPVYVPAVPPAEAGPRLAPGLVYLKRISVLDDPGMIGGEAFSILAPTDWQVQGGVSWRMHPGAPASPVVRLANPSRTEVIDALPCIPFVWMEGGIPLFPPGSKYLGNEVGEPITDPIAYIKQIIVPRFRGNVTAAEIIGAEDLPAVAEAIVEMSKEPGVEKKFRAARMRLEYAEDGTVMHEDIYCVLAIVTLPEIKTTFWGPDRNYSFKAERGKLDERTPLFHEIVTSFKPNLRWFSRYMQLTRLLAQTQLDPSRPPSDLGQYIAQTSLEISDEVRKLYQQQQVARDRVNASFRRYVPGTARYRDPFDGRSLELPGGFSQVWINLQGERLLSATRGVDPGQLPGEGWKRAERAP